MDQQWQETLEKIKMYFTTHPVLNNPIKGKSLLLYIAKLNNLLDYDWHSAKGKENDLFYLN